MSDHEHPLVDFEGEWPARDRALLAEVIEVIEREAPPRTTRRLLGKPWICVYWDREGEAYYMAHWSRRLELILTARSVEELAVKMRDLAASMKP
jgi:hypothetical protein